MRNQLVVGRSVNAGLSCDMGESQISGFASLGAVNRTGAGFSSADRSLHRAQASILSSNRRRTSRNLRAKNLRCWFAPEDWKGGDRFQCSTEEKRREDLFLNGRWFITPEGVHAPEHTGVQKLEADPRSEISMQRILRKEGVIGGVVNWCRQEEG